MNKTEVHPIELALVAGLVVLEALLALVAAVVALLVTLARCEVLQPSAPGPHDLPAPTPEPPVIKAPAIPQLHPLALIATQLQALPVSALRQMANTRSKTIRKAQLIELIACN